MKYHSIETADLQRSDKDQHYLYLSGRNNTLVPSTTANYQPHFVFAFISQSRKNAGTWFLHQIREQGFAKY